jgi:hypothetical protein
MRRSDGPFAKGAKAPHLIAFIGTTEVVPFHKAIIEIMGSWRG